MTKLGVMFVLAFAGASKAADVCPNFTGEFVIQDERGQSEVTITQTACEQIRIDRTTNSRGTTTREQHTLKLDGKFQNDSGWLGNSDKTQTAARFVSAALEITVRPPSATNDTDFSLKFLYVLRSNGDLDIRDFDRKNNAYVPTVLATRRQ